MDREQNIFSILEGLNNRRFDDENNEVDNEPKFLNEKIITNILRGDLSNFYRDINIVLKKNNLFPDSYFSDKKDLKFKTDYLPFDRVAVYAEYKDSEIRMSYEIDWFDNSYNSDNNKDGHCYKNKIGITVNISMDMGKTYSKDSKSFEIILVTNYSNFKDSIENLNQLKTYLTNKYNEWYNTSKKIFKK